MAKSDSYLHYKAQLVDAVTVDDFDHIIAAAFRDYLKYRLDDTEYGRIYFACVRRLNSIYEPTVTAV